MKSDVIRKIEEEKIIAIARGVNAENCLKTAKALYEGGVRLIEVTFNQKDKDSFAETAKAINLMNKELKGKVLVGAGTVTSKELVEIAYQAGAKYIISPDTNVEVIKRTKEFGMISMPGALTPSEVLTAYNAGADFVKLFPIGCFSPAYVKALRAPINHVPLLAVGGVNEKNIKEYFEAGCVGAGIGGNLAKKEWIESGEYDKLTEAAIKLLEAIKE